MLVVVSSRWQAWAFCSVGYKVNFVSALFIRGFEQLFQLPPHLLLLIVLGLCLGQQYSLQHNRDFHATRKIALTIPTLVLSVMLGLILSTQNIPAWPYPMLLLSLTLLLGSSVILQLPLPLWLLLGVSALGGMLLGISAEPLILPGFSPSKIASVFVGITLASGLLCAAVTLFASILHRLWQGIGVRILGSWVTACALLVLALHSIGDKLAI